MSEWYGNTAGVCGVMLYYHLKVLSSIYLRLPPIPVEWNVTLGLAATNPTFLNLRVFSNDGNKCNAESYVLIYDICCVHSVK
jgi:hypothetical protein